MQKVIRRTEYAKRYAARKIRKREVKEARRDRQYYRAEMGDVKRQERAVLKQSRLRRREDWELGALSPWKRGAAAIGSENLWYGAYGVYKQQPPKVAKLDQRRDWFVRVGDRVCVVAGREGVKGMIGRVLVINEEAQTIGIEGVNRLDIHMPHVLFSKDQAPVQTQEVQVPADDVRLVYPLPDPATGVPRDTILTNLVRRDFHVDPYENRVEWSRYLEPQGLKIPWPAPPASELPQNQPEHAGDTRRLHVDAASWLPTLLRPPMPLGVVDELRGRYSVFRDRHDPAWVARKVAQDDAAAAGRKVVERVRPRGATNVARTLGRAATAGGAFMLGSASVRLSDDLWRAIGAHMERRGVTLPLKTATAPDAQDTASSNAPVTKSSTVDVADGSTTRLRDDR